MLYKGIKITIEGKWIKLVHLEAVDALNIKGMPKEYYPQGIKLISIPDQYLDKPIEYAKYIVDRTIDWYKHHRSNEFRIYNMDKVMKWS
jgi:hypothetical protein